MEFEEKYRLIEQTVQHYADKFGMFTAEDLISEAWCHKQVREADIPKHVVKATKDACVNFLREWNKFSKTGTKTEIKVIYTGTMMENKMSDLYEYVEDNTTDLLKEDLYKQMSEEERTIIEYLLQGWTYEEIAEKLKKKKSTVYAIHKRMQESMKQKQEQLLGD